MTSLSPEWRTPLDLFAVLHQRHQFTLDAAATRRNALLPNYFTRKTNGLTQDWSPYRVWCNPPYGRDIGKWTAKAAASGAYAVLLVPARTDTAWWHDDVVARETQIGYVRGRIKFQSALAGAPFPSALILYHPGSPRLAPVTMSTAGKVIGLIGSPLAGL